MSTVTVRPSGLQFQASADETVMAAAERDGLVWPTTCHGLGECRTCVMFVLDGIEMIGPPTAFEQAALQSITFSLHGGHARWRLACQAHVAGDVTVRKPGVSRR